MIEVTLRGGPGEEEPWIVIRANTIDEAIRLINTTPKEISDGLRQVRQ